MRNKEKVMNLTHTRLQKKKQIYTVKKVLTNHLTHQFFLSHHQRLRQITSLVEFD